jgi:hypothetical protein
MGLGETQMARIPDNVATLLQALQFRDARTDALRHLDDRQWTALLRFSELGHLTLLLPQLPETILPDWVAARVHRNCQDNARRFDNIRATYLELAQALRAARVEHLVLKGFAQFPGYVADPRLRMQSDIDLVCPPQSISAARDALIALGYEHSSRTGHGPSDHLPTMVRNTGWQWRGNDFDPEMPPSVELHHCLWNEAVERFAAPGADQFWSRRVLQRLRGSSPDSLSPHAQDSDAFEFPALHPVDKFGYSALHILRNLLRRDWVIHQVYELARFLHLNAQDTSFWSSWRKLHSDRLRSLETIACILATAWFSCDLPPAIVAEVDFLPPPVRHWLQRFAASPLEAMFHPNKDAVWLHASLVQSARTRRAVLMQNLLPARIPAVNAEGQQLTKYRTEQSGLPAQRHVRYLIYLFSRLIYHLRSSLLTVWRGCLWWLSQKASPS